ncbi:MAG: hypothetical protein JWO22_3486 [Frankiales bacterium]|nr:hypothetical protein [Frankiales bacterium]
MQVRIARQTGRLDEVVAFYEGLGLPRIGGFEDHDGFTGVMLAVPGTAAHLELVTGGAHEPPAPHPESLLVLYLGSRAEVERLSAGLEPVPSANPYWDRCGVTVADPDGFRVVLCEDTWQTEEGL